jgi:hypothetical protein
MKENKEIGIIQIGNVFIDNIREGGNSKKEQNTVDTFSQFD